MHEVVDCIKGGDDIFLNIIEQIFEFTSLGELLECERQKRKKTLLQFSLTKGFEHSLILWIESFQDCKPACFKGENI